MFCTCYSNISDKHCLSGGEGFPSTWFSNLLFKKCDNYNLKRITVFLTLTGTHTLAQLFLLSFNEIFSQNCAAIYITLKQHLWWDIFFSLIADT